MVNTSSRTTPSTRTDLGPVPQLVTTYVALVAATVVALIALSALGSDQATGAAWGHAVIVAGFAVLLPMRLRAARAGSASAVRAVAVIATVLLVVNLVEAVLPGAFPVWMRVEMIAVALLMAAVVASVVRRVVRPRAG